MCYHCRIVLQIKILNIVVVVVVFVVVINEDLLVFALVIV